MLSRQQILTSANIVAKRLFPEHYFFEILGIKLFTITHPLSLCLVINAQKVLNIEDCEKYCSGNDLFIMILAE
jgi:hypothetical protein